MRSVLTSRPSDGVNRTFKLFRLLTPPMNDINAAIDTKLTILLIVITLAV